MSPEERDDLIDLLPLPGSLADQPPKHTPIWADDEELAEGHFADRDFRWWMDALGHPKAHPGCCATCGCATTCLASAFYDAVVTTTVRELDKIGALREPGGVR